MPDYLPSVLGPLVAVLVAIVAQYCMVRRDEKRQARRAFAESIIQCCEEMENVAIAYWTDSVPGTEGLVGKMNAALCKMIRTIDAASCISADERKNLKDRWKFIQRVLLHKFEIEDRKIDAERAMQVVGIVIDARCEAARMRA